MTKHGAIRIGCSGWNYRHWRGTFYPDGLPQKRWFRHYAANFDTVEINNSFYRLPEPGTFDKWREAAPPGFCYAVKANRYITHTKKLKDCEQPIARMLTPFRHLKSRLGPILYQLPPRFGINLERLESFIALLPRSLSHVFEFRDTSWLTEEVLALLDEKGMSVCAHDMPGLETPRWAAGKMAYVRFHGTGGKYVGRYSEESLEAWARWMRKEAGAGRTVWAYFNNDIQAHAIADAKALKALIED